MNKRFLTIPLTILFVTIFLILLSIELANAQENNVTRPEKPSATLLAAPSLATPQVISDTVDCAVLAPPVVGLEISKGQEA